MHTWQNMYRSCMLKTAKMLMRKIQEDLNNWKGICYSWIARLNTVKMSFVPKLIYRLNAIPIKTPARYFLQIQMSGYTYITLQLCSRRNRISVLFFYSCLWTYNYLKRFIKKQNCHFMHLLQEWKPVSAIRKCGLDFEELLRKLLDGHESHECRTQFSWKEKEAPGWHMVGK